MSITMNSQSHGKHTSEIEVTNVSSDGVWLLIVDKEFFIPYDEFPWFKEVPIGKILKGEEQTPGHFYWPELDIDLGIESIEHPEQFPIKAKQRITSSSSPRS